ncbi:Hypothetical_protein [Hexamita inflata]|uniref:Hypothetical_protein n=1 Tax=Hexamita inflata TaxID=28002 RepID=A0AA86UT09_9EUKA|nr:Hypothetical protein HINF_LOCUS54479 [Hexamita inflata]
MRLSQIGCRRQNPPVQSAELPSRIGMAKGLVQLGLVQLGACHQRTPRLESGNRISIASLEAQMVRPMWIPVYIGLHKVAALRTWMIVPKSLVALTAEVRLTYIGVSKTNVHSRGLTVPVKKTELVQTIVKWQIKYLTQKILDMQLSQSIDSDRVQKLILKNTCNDQIQSIFLEAPNLAEFSCQ